MINTYTINRDCEVREVLLGFSKMGIFLEGSILKVIKAEDGDDEFKDYILNAKKIDTDKRRKRLNVTKKIQLHNSELEAITSEQQNLSSQLESALNTAKLNEQRANEEKNKAELAKEKAMEDLEIMQKRTQFRLMSLIVKVALSIIIGIGLATTFLYAYSISTGQHISTIENTWSNLFGILITNAFSIIGTIMGVRYAGNFKNQQSEEYL